MQGSKNAHSERNPESRADIMKRALRRILTQIGCRKTRGQRGPEIVNSREYASRPGSSRWSEPEVSVRAKLPKVQQPQGLAIARKKQKHDRDAQGNHA